MYSVESKKLTTFDKCSKKLQHVVFLTTTLAYKH